MDKPLETTHLFNMWSFNGLTIDLSSSANNNNISYNEIFNYTMRGISIREESHGNTVLGNTIEDVYGGSAQFAVQVHDSNDTIVELNEITNVPGGISLDNASHSNIIKNTIIGCGHGTLISSESSLNNYTAGGFYNLTLNITDSNSNISSEVKVDYIHVLSLGGDEDGDGLTNAEEIQVHGTNPLVSDTDGDTYSDGDEINAGSDPLNGNSIPASGGLDPMWMLLIVIIGILAVVAGLIVVKLKAKKNRTASK